MKAEDKLQTMEMLKEERQCSDEKYAPMIVKTIVYSAIGLICVAFVSYLAAKVWPH